MIRWLVDLVYPICPVCGGSGGASHGYYDGDWTGCFVCNPEEDREEPVVRIWFWQVWRWRYDCWQMDRWVDRQVKAAEADKDKYEQTGLGIGRAPWPEGFPDE